MEQLEGKVVVITGGAAGIGRALAEAFGSQGCHLALADIDADGLTRTVDELSASGLEVIGVPTDVTDAAAVDHLRDRTIDHFGAADVVCANAGVGSASAAPMWETSAAEFGWVMDVNVNGVLNCVRSFVPELLEQQEGHVVITGSAAAIGAMPFYGPYTASKHAAFGLAVGLSLELQALRADVGVSVLCPDFLRSGIANSERLWPEDKLGPKPQAGADPVSQFMVGFFKQVVDDAPGPEALAADTVAAVRENRFLVRTETPLMDSILDDHRRVMEGERPAPPI